MVHELSHRFFEIVNDEKRSATAVKQPILQLLDMRPVANTFRLQLSDGQYIWSCLCIHARSSRDSSTCATTRTNLPLILRIKQYDTNVKINERGYSRLTLCIRDMEILERRVPKIGNPVSLSAILDQKSRQGSSATGVMDTENKNPTGAPSAKASTPRRPVNYGGGFSSDVTPIAMITPYVSKWRVCGLASQKSNVRNVKSARGEFKVFSFTLSDKNGSDLRVSAFGDVADRLFTIIQNGDMYYLTGSPTIVKAADKRYNSTGHDYEVTVRNDNDIVHCTDRPLIGLAPLKLNVTPLDKISAAVGKNVDILAVVEKVEDVTEVLTDRCCRSRPAPPATS
ncbi:hypothetical protein L596_027645 [Steinernema carpocapsae]|uniref:Replication protein A OB domain-containing protein n=1 Tax=Steinernema carpocapsae TaxID=34508 RepID=A0A4U5LW45_STECR|nr:hypothetical protein L596_027645 [Steinernema carpocapsae]